MAQFRPPLRAIATREHADLKQLITVTTNLDEVAKAATKPNIQAIPVWWNGFRFRSRTEGRWAVAFQHLGIEFEYEPQGFKLANGVCYLPDFYLPQIRAWAEVKGCEASPVEVEKCELAIRELGGLFLILSGSPDFQAYAGVSLDCGELSNALYSLDIHQGKNWRYYSREGRLFSAPDPLALDEKNVSPRYRAAIFASRAERFNSREMPQPDSEPFNPSPRDMGGAW